MEHDLTVGKPSKVLWLFCLPLFGSIIFQQLYNLADSLVAGKFIGEDALAAVGNGYEITLVFLAFAFGCNIGCSVVTSRLYGEKRFGAVKSCIYTAIIATTAICIILTILGIFLTKPLLKSVNLSEAVSAFLIFTLFFCKILLQPVSPNNIKPHNKIINVFLFTIFLLFISVIHFVYLYYITFSMLLIVYFDTFI